jgi:hypothetical protein
LFSAAQLAQLQGHHARERAPRAGEHYVAGLDLAGAAFEQEVAGQPSSRDSTVLTIARVRMPARDAALQEPRLEVVEHYVWTDQPHDLLFPRLADLLRDVWRVRRVAVDATGLGETIARLLLSALGSTTVRPVRFSAESKSRLGYSLLAAVNSGRLKLYAADGSIEYRHCRQELEHAQATYRINRTMNYFVEPAKGHDDYLASLALLVEAAHDATPRAARGYVRAW